MPKTGVPNYDAPPLPTASEASGNELPPARKMFSDFFSNLQIVSLQQMNVRYFGKYTKKIIYRKKIRLQVEKSGVLTKIFCPQIFWNFAHN